jgi:iron(III) transport system permease protein
VVALALVFFGVNFARPVYQTIWLLVFAYAVLFFPVALGSVRSSLLQISPRVEDAARGLGHNPVRVLLKITIPMMKSGVLMGAALVFLLTMKELPATLILGPLGFKTLASSVWSASSEAFFARAAAPALMLVLMSSVPMAILVLREKHRKL